MDYLTAAKKVYEKLSIEEKIKFHAYLQAQFERDDNKLVEIRENIISKLTEVDKLAKEYISRIF